MLFFKDEDTGQDYSATRVVTTMLHGMADILPDSQAEARSYTFSIASNTKLPKNLAPTLIMYYDQAAYQTGDDLLIHRQDEAGTWHPMPTYLPDRLSFAAMPLNAKTAPTLFAVEAEQRIERYRLYWTPRERLRKG